MAGQLGRGRAQAGTRARRRVALSAVAAALTLTAAACGSDDKPITTAEGNQSATTVTTGAVVTTAAPKPTVSTATNASLGTIMVEASGRTLYTFDKDTGPTSACTGNCAATWPPLVLQSGANAPTAAAGLTDLTAVARPDDAAKMQVVWNGKPLYTYAADTAPGDTKGDGVGGNWHVAKPA